MSGVWPIPVSHREVPTGKHGSYKEQATSDSCLAMYSMHLRVLPLPEVSSGLAEVPNLKRGALISDRC